MNPISEITKPLMKEIVTPIGFHSKGVSFYRLMNGFVQSFKIYAQHNHCSIRFYMSPLCAKLDLHDEGEDISKFWSNSSEFIYVSDLMSGIEMPTFFWDEYDKEVPIPTIQVKTVEQASEMLITWFNQYLLLWFSESNTLEKGFEADFNFEHRFHAHSGDSKRKTEQVHAMRWYYWMMQMGNAEKALYYLDIEIALQKEFLEMMPISFEHITDEKIKQQEIERNTKFRNNYLLTLQDMRENIINRDMAYINDVVNEGTNNSLRNLKLKRVKVWEGD